MQETPSCMGGDHYQSANNCSISNLSTGKSRITIAQMISSETLS